ncbi:MAG: hypothetical protein HY897_21680 [Deltaproteobacteria bacterium]|nr:hypothetical protein [Deltaproteobacteria bacterium]
MKNLVLASAIAISLAFAILGCESGGSSDAATNADVGAKGGSGDEDAGGGGNDGGGDAGGDGGGASQTFCEKVCAYLKKCDRGEDPQCIDDCDKEVSCEKENTSASCFDAMQADANCMFGKACDDDTGCDTMTSECSTDELTAIHDCYMPPGGGD